MKEHVISIDAKQAHRQVAAFLGLFLVIHFAAHFSALGGPAAHSAALKAGRAAYHVLPLEILLIAAFVAQIGLGITLLRRIAKRAVKGFWHRLQAASGIYLIIFIVNHVTAALITRLIAGLDTNYYWAAGTLVTDILKYGFWPYYMLAVTALISHLVCALHFRGAKRWHAPALGLGPLIGLGAIAGYSGALQTVVLPAAYQDYFASLAGLIN